MVSVSHLVKRYGARLAVDDLTFEVGKGEVVGFLGPNGAGKSTTLRILSGFLGMTSGKVTVAGHDIEEDSYEARKLIGYMPEAVPLYPEMRVAEYLTFRADLKRVKRSERRAAVDASMEKANVTDVANVLIGKLSKGYRQRVGLADALVAKPPLLVLDEPTAGLDPNQIREVRDVIKALGREHTVLLSTHILSEVEASCGRVVVIAKGKLVAEGATKDIQRMRRAGAIDVTVRGERDVVIKALKSIAGVAKAKALGEPDAGVATYRCTWAKKHAEADVAAATEAMVAALVAAGAHVREVKGAGTSLEDVFTELTRGAVAADADDEATEADA
jgi:ABC-2 type transport system ATP-binding protein